MVGKLNIDDEKEIADKYSVMSIPTVKVFKNGEVLGTMVGAQSIARLREMVKVK